MINLEDFVSDKEVIVTFRGGRKHKGRLNRNSRRNPSYENLERVSCWPYIFSNTVYNKVGCSEHPAFDMIDIKFVEEPQMTKKLYSVSVIYDIMVVADESETPETVAKAYLEFMKDEEPRYVNHGAVREITSGGSWYNGIPYGYADGKPAQYYTTDEIEKRKSIEVVEKVKNMLTVDELKILKTQLCKEN